MLWSEKAADSTLCEVDTFVDAELGKRNVCTVHLRKTKHYLFLKKNLIYITALYYCEVLFTFLGVWRPLRVGTCTAGMRAGTNNCLNLQNLPLTALIGGQ